MGSPAGKTRASRVAHSPRAMTLRIADAHECRLVSRAYLLRDRALHATARDAARYCISGALDEAMYVSGSLCSRHLRFA